MGVQLPHFVDASVVTSWATISRSYAVSGEAAGDRAVAVTVQVFGEDPAYHLSRRLVDGEDTQPLALGCFAWVGVRPTIY